MARKKPPPQTAKAEPKVIQNRRARFDYEFLETHEAGIALVGSEAKSLWLGKVNLTDAYCEIRDGELWVAGLDIEPYVHAGPFAVERRRDRKLLMHRKEIDRLAAKVKEKGLTLVLASLYFKNGRFKAAVALARGKRQYDKREQIAEREKRREIEQARSRRE
jgi:SsrA-binding protein